MAMRTQVASAMIKLPIAMVPTLMNARYTALNSELAGPAKSF